MQIRLRLTLQFIFIAAGILLASFFYVHFQFKKNLQDEFYENLRSKAFIIAEMVAERTPRIFHTNNLSLLSQANCLTFTLRIFHYSRWMDGGFTLLIPPRTISLLLS